MYLHAMIGLLLAGPFRDRADRRAEGRGRHAPPASLAEFGDHHLRDIGYVRDRTVAPRRHLFWM